MTPGRGRGRRRVRLDGEELKRERIAVARRDGNELRATLVVEGEREEVLVGEAALMTTADMKRRQRARVRLRTRELLREEEQRSGRSGLSRVEIAAEMRAALRRASPPKTGRPGVDPGRVRLTFEELLRFYECSRADAFRKTAQEHGFTERKVRIIISKH